MIRFLALQVVSQDQYIASRTGRKEHSDESDEIPDSWLRLKISACIVWITGNVQI